MRDIEREKNKVKKNERYRKDNKMERMTERGS